MYNLQNIRRPDGIKPQGRILVFFLLKDFFFPVDGSASLITALCLMQICNFVKSIKYLFFLLVVGHCVSHSI